MDLTNFFKELDLRFREKPLAEVEEFIVGSLKQAQIERDFPALLAISNELGGVLRVTNRFEEAKQIYTVALETIKLLKLEQTEQHGTTLMNMASVFSEQKQAKEALRLYEEVARIFVGLGLSRDYRMAALFNNISHAHDMLGHLEESLDFAKKSLDVIRNLKGNEVELGTSLTTLGTRCLSNGLKEEALQYLMEADQVFCGICGKPNPHYAATLNSLGELAYLQGRLSESVAFYEKSLEILKESYGENQAFQNVKNNLQRVKEKIGSSSSRMTGLELSEAYYETFGKPMIEAQFGEYQKYMAIGLVGEGSECFGYDDQWSEDHDYGPGFCIWIPEEQYQAIGAALSGAYTMLPKEFEGKRRMETLEGNGRVGVFRISQFYKKYIGCTGVPTTSVEWIFAPETSLATATNGKVFVDHLGEFSRIRNELLQFYPRDVFLKKIVARMALMSQSGQYNYERCMKRNEVGAAYLACCEFVKATTSMVYLLNKKYMPFYKWTFRGMEGMTSLKDVKPMLTQLIQIPDVQENVSKKVQLIETISILVGEELRHQGVITGTDAFLNSHCHQVMNSIKDPQIRSLPVMFDGK